MNYDEATEQEINEAVELISHPLAKFVDTPFGRRLQIADFTARIKCPDYCNSWAAAGPIIEKYKITIIGCNEFGASK